MKTACITGASSGIGLEFAKILAKEGYELILVGRNESALNNLKETLNTKSTVIICDLSDITSVKHLGEELIKNPPFILINNAGFGDLGLFHETSPETDLDMINVNVAATHLLTKLLLPEFIKRNSGYILNVASSAGLLMGGPYMATYYATKSYVVSLTGAIYQELKALNSKVHISALCPGPVDTNFNNRANVVFSLPGISAQSCAGYGLKQMFKNKLIIVPTFSMKLLCFASRFAPRKIMLYITGKQQHRKLG